MRCDRCGESTRVLLRDDFSLKYYPEEALTEEELELAVDDLGVGWFQENTIDLGQVICEVVALSLPNRVVCVDGSSCDTRMNKLLGEAQVERLTGHPGFAALKGLRQSP